VATPVTGNFNQVLDEIGIRYEIAGRIPHKKSKLGGMIESNGLSKLTKLLRKNKYDIVHTHLNSYGGFLSKLITSAKVVHTRHGVFWSESELNQMGFLSKTFQKIKSRVFDITIAIGEYEKNTLENVFGYNPDKIRLTYNGVNVNEIQSSLNKNLSKKELFSTEDIIVGAVGRLEKQKGFDVFLYAAKKVIEKIPNVKFVIIGEGSLKYHLLELKNELDLKDKFEFIDYKKNIYDYMNCFDIMVQTSLWEGISYVVLEAMALSKPVIAMTSKNVSGVKEIIIQGETGYLVESDYSNQLSKYIIEIASNTDKLKTTGAAGFERVKTVFSEERTSKDMEQLYSDLVSNINK
jgi:glycosyltransferase involved in cell wall biosynthesis